MGKMIIQACVKDPDVKITAGVEQAGSPFVGKDAGETAGVGSLGAVIADDLAKVVNTCDVVIDFTFPAVTLANLEICRRNGKKMVIGTTGLSSAEVGIVRNAGQSVAVVQSPNMSIGVNLLFKIIADVTAVLSDYDIEIVEAHHNQKKDAPSGTAEKLAQVIAGVRNNSLEETGVYGRKGIVGARKKGELGVHAVRGGDIVGDHTILFAGEGERIEVKHQAHSRMTFASGAVKAARFLAGKDKGFFTMKEVLGL
jgi:4-hydroxy-tetrahydrodipicolinate reductase